MFFSNCTERDTISTTPDSPYYDQGYNYFPSQDGYQWTYKTTVSDGNGNITSEKEEIAVYDKSTSQLNFTVDNNAIGYANWYNINQRLQCCSGSILLDYSELDCLQDSTLIREENTENDTYITTHQHCKTKTIELENYKDVECIKTYQRNRSVNGSEVHIFRYFGYGVGLLKEVQTYVDIDGEIVAVKQKELKSHRF